MLGKRGGYQKSQQSLFHDICLHASGLPGGKPLVFSEISANWHSLSTYQVLGTTLSAFYTYHFIHSFHNLVGKVVNIICTS